MIFFLNEKVCPVMKPPKPPQKTSPPASLEFSGFGIRFAAIGTLPICGGLLLALAALVVFSLFPGAFTDMAGMARDVAITRQEPAQPPQPVSGPREAQTLATAP
nr:hypothetical protein [Brevundimonas naejangsanensis]